MRSFDQVFADALRLATREAMDEPVGYCTAHGPITRAEDHVFKNCRKCWEEKCQATAKPGS